MPQLKTKTFGSVDLKWIAPASVTEKTIAVGIPFKDALHLHLALGQCLAKINQYNMATSAGKNALVRLNIYRDKKRIMVMEG